jgi:hypothetical protein
MAPTSPEGLPHPGPASGAQRMTQCLASTRMTPQPVIHVAAIRKTYGGTVAVDDVSFHVQPGKSSV